MENQMQNSIRYSVVSTTIEISKHIEIGKLIGRKGHIEKEEKNVRISDNGNHQQATPRNHKDNDQKEKRKRYKRKMSHTTKTRQVRYFKNL
ncbi:hypothetical protein RhiirA4_481300 [Rhizophagus irregularis]|uniref:K Homology domain-containing protein n=1 Tax=Rhizophagus irregularis TaxID=588596 RepID=A0A2I1HJ93_9GLOM|nr:hypothetical protein RhiirA4_481300 [Rhizophagus irregularis]